MWYCMAQRDDFTRPIRRRTWLKIASGGVLTALAGCSGRENGGSTGTNDNPFGDQSSEVKNSNAVDPEFTTTMEVIPTNQNFNPWAASAVFYIDGQYLVYSWPALYFPDGSVRGILAKDWTVEGDTGSITFKDDITWHNGKEITARDYVVGRKMDRLVKGTEDPTFTDFKATDNKTVEFSITEKASSKILQLDLFRRHTSTMLRTPRFVYEKHLKELQNAKEQGEKALETARGEFIKKNITEQVGSGPLKIEGLSQQAMTLTPHDGHPGGKQLNFESLRMEYVENDQQQARGMINDNFDGLKEASTNQEMVEKYPDHVKLLPRPLYSGMGLLMNNSAPLLDDPRVRQAIGHVVDPTPIINRYKSVSTHPKESFYSGASKFSIDQWLGSGLSKKFTDYTGSNTKTAASLLTEAGFTTNGNNWMTPDGGEFNVTIKIPGSGSRGFGGQSAAQDLSQFGINAEAKSMEEGTAFGEFKNGNYQLGIWGYGSLNTAHPYFDYWTTFSPEGWWSSICSTPEVVSVPALGTPDGSRQTMNVVDLVSQSKTGTETERKNGIQKLAWAFNQSLPLFPLREEVARSAITTDEWNVPNEKTLTRSLAPHLLLPQFGKLKAKTK